MFDNLFCVAGPMWVVASFLGGMALLGIFAIAFIVFDASPPRVLGRHE